MSLGGNGYYRRRLLEIHFPRRRRLRRATLSFLKRGDFTPVLLILGLFLFVLFVDLLKACLAGLVMSPIFVVDMRRAWVLGRRNIDAIGRTGRTQHGMLRSLDLLPF